MNRPKPRVNIELLLGISATFLSLAALIVSIFQTKIAREQQQASVWPYLQIGMFLSQDNNTSEFEVQLTNNGVGPALIKRISLAYQGKQYQTYHAVFTDEVAEVKDSAGSQAFWREVERGVVIKAGEEWPLFKLTGRDKSIVRASTKASNSTFHYVVTYSDVYGNCWRLDRNKVTSSECPD